MKGRLMLNLLRAGFAAAAGAVTLAGLASGQMPSGLADRVMTITRESVWRRAAAIPLTFRTHHPQGLVKIGDQFFMSSVEIRVRTKRFATPTGPYDRDTGEGVGHLFKIDAAGNRLADLELGEGAIYHPGGIDFDGTDIWVAVAEYRPNSRSIVYRVNPATMKAIEVFRFGDHLGAIVHNTDDRTLHAVSWGSRRFYRWTLDAAKRVANAETPPDRLRTLNPSHYVDYQDCKYAGGRRMLCTGVTELRTSAGAPPFRLGGMDLVDLADGRPVHQVPVLLWTPQGLDMTHNPVWLELRGAGVRAYFVPEDDTSTLYVYDVEAG
jgi:hypothetical protein